MKGKTQQAAGAASGMSERSVRNWSQAGACEDHCRRRRRRIAPRPPERRQRTRPDPLAGVWEQDIEPLLRADIEGVLTRSTSRRLFWSGWTGGIRGGSA